MIPCIRLVARHRVLGFLFCLSGPGPDVSLDGFELETGRSISVGVGWIYDRVTSRPEGYRIREYG